MHHMPAGGSFLQGFDGLLLSKAVPAVFAVCIWGMLFVRLFDPLRIVFRCQIAGVRLHTDPLSAFSIIKPAASWLRTKRAFLLAQRAWGDGCQAVLLETCFSPLLAAAGAFLVIYSGLLMDDTKEKYRAGRRYFVLSPYRTSFIYKYIEIKEYKNTISEPDPLTLCP